MPFESRIVIGARRREGRKRRPLPPRRRRLLPEPRHHRHPRHDRNGSCYKSFAFRDACKALGLRHIRTRPYTPKTNGKAERFVQTPLREWAYARAYPSSEHRKAALEPWLHNYNGHRPHGSLHSMPPISRLAQPMNNLLRLHI